VKYIKDDEQGFTSFSDYFSYLASMKHEFEEKIHAFLADETRYDLGSRGSLHDAWIKSLTFNSPFVIDELADDVPNVQLVLLGPYHDRDFVLSYFGVLACDMNLQLSDDDRKKDLLIHECSIEAGVMVHEILFDGDMTIKIRCKSMRFEEKLHFTDNAGV
jgi:hypothetical protein